MRIRVLLYKFQGAVCREDNASPFFEIIHYFFMLYHYDLYSYCCSRVCDCHYRCYTSHQVLQSQSLIIFGQFSWFLAEKVVLLQPIQLLSRN